MFRFFAGFLFFFAALSSHAAEISLDSFTHENPAAVWRPVENAPPPEKIGARGTVFSCPFDRNVDRAYWDREVSLNLAAYTALAAEISCDDPAGLRAFGIYLHSGNGWYVWAKPLREGGRQTLVMQKSGFSSEGAPAGWERIDRIRISPWRGAAKKISFTMFSLSARRDARIVIKSTASSPNAADRAYAGKITERISRIDRKSTRLNSSHHAISRMPSSA